MWDGMEKVATIAQLAGVDLFGLISMTVRAAGMARQNSRRCRELAERVARIGDLLRSLEQMPGAAVMERRPETSVPLLELHETLRQACALVESCRRGSYIRRLCVGGAQAGRFRDVQSRIAFFLQLFPIISHVDNTRLLVRVIDGASVPPQHCEPEGDEEAALSSLSNQPDPLARFQKFSFSQLLKATNNFSFEEEMERSPLAASYKDESEIPDGPSDTMTARIDSQGRLDGADVSVTIKRISVSSSGQQLPQSMNVHELFKNEIKILPQLRHKNIVKLVGFCAERSERILVYEHMQNGSLEDIIFGCAEGAGLKLDWPSRLRIIEGVAQGAAYLHDHSGLRVIHRDLKPSNILLDADMNPKICNFDLAKMLSPGMDVETTGSVIGSVGFIAPEYMQNGAFSVKTDVYSFGVMVLETISGKRWTESSQQSYYQDLLKWAWAQSYGVRAARTALKGFVHPSLHGVSFCSRALPRCLSFPARRSVLSQQREMKRCVQTSLLCIQEKPERRPSMTEVTRLLSPRKRRVPRPRLVRFTKQSALYAGDRSPVA